MFLINKITKKECPAAQWTGKDSLNSFLLMFPEGSFTSKHGEHLYCSLPKEKRGGFSSSFTMTTGGWIVFDEYYRYIGNDKIKSEYNPA